MVDRFGEKLMRLRRQRGWTFATLARRLGYQSRGYLSEVESGKKQPSVDLVLGVSRVFGVSTDELLKDELEVGILQDDEQDEPPSGE